MFVLLFHSIPIGYLPCSESSVFAVAGYEPVRLQRLNAFVVIEIPVRYPLFVKYQINTKRRMMDNIIGEPIPIRGPIRDISVLLDS